MKGKDVHAELAAKLSPWFKANGFGKRSAGNWRKRHDDFVISAWFQMSTDARDDWAGHKFTFQFERFVDRLDHSTRRSFRLGWLLSEERMREAQALHNRIVASLPRPPDAHFDWMDANLRAWYLRKFVPDDAPWTNKPDLWFRYRDVGHVRLWAAWLETVLGEAFERFLARG